MSQAFVLRAMPNVEALATVTVAPAPLLKPKLNPSPESTTNVPLVASIVPMLRMLKFAPPPPTTLSAVRRMPAPLTTPAAALL